MSDARTPKGCMALELHDCRITMDSALYGVRHAHRIEIETTETMRELTDGFFSTMKPPYSVLLIKDSQSDDSSYEELAGKMLERGRS